MRTRLGLVLLSGALALVVGELLVRALLPYNTPDTVRAHSLPWVSSVYSAQRLEPVDRTIEIDKQKGWGVKAGDATPARVFHINDQGYRGPRFPVAKPAGSTRVLVLGGSAAFDLQASTYDDWPSQVQVLLRERLGRDDVEVINAALPGSASMDSLGRLLTQAWMYSPDLVLFYHAWNDVKYFRELAPDRPLLSLYAPHHPENNPFTAYANGFDRLAGSSQLYIKLRGLLLGRVLDLGPEGRVPWGGEPHADYGELGPRQFRLVVDTFVDACRNLGAEPVLLTQALLVTADSPEQDRARIDYRYQGLTHEALVRALAEANGILREVAASEGTLLIDLDASLSGRPELFHDHVHTTAAGSAEIAALVGAALAERLARR